MAKTTRRTKPVTDARLANTSRGRAPIPPQPLSRKRTPQQQPKERPAATPAAARVNKAPTGQPRTLPRSGSKQALLLSLLSRQQGASLSEMMQATGWLPHTTRAALTGLRQRGCTIERFTTIEGSSTYRITSSTPATADGEKA